MRPITSLKEVQRRAMRSMPAVSAVILSLDRAVTKQLDGCLQVARYRVTDSDQGQGWCQPDCGDGRD